TGTFAFQVPAQTATDLPYPEQILAPGNGAESVVLTWSDTATTEDGVEIWMDDGAGTGNFSKLTDVEFWDQQLLDGRNPVGYQQIQVTGLSPLVGYKFKIRAY